MEQKPQFASKLGLVAATVGSAVGLGNVWRFPAEAQTNGGAAFLLIYVACVLLLGIPVMVAEFSLGRGTRHDAVGAFRSLAPKRPWWIVGAGAILASYLILMFYSVVVGWTMEYLWNSVTGDLFRPVAAAQGGGLDAQFTEKMNEYVMTAFSPIFWSYVMLFVQLGILIMGVRKGIEKMSNVLMPLLFLLLLVFCTVSLLLPNAAEGVRFFLRPDFSKINVGTVVSALGQAFFSLSMGMGILITYSSYFPKNTRLSRTALTVSLLDMLVAFMMGMVIFPAVKSFGLEGHALQGTTLVFVTLPEVFAQMPATQFWSVLFFLLLTVAALTSTISIAEVSIAFMQDKMRMSRTKACLAVLLPVFVFSPVCSLSLGACPALSVGGLSVFGFLDKLATNYMLPLVALSTCVFMGWFAPKDFFFREATNGGTAGVRYFPLIRFIIRYVAPVLIALILLAEIFS